jgi:hypothetical protein
MSSSVRPDFPSVPFPLPYYLYCACEQQTRGDDFFPRFDLQMFAEPYKDYFLDLLDMCLLGSLFLIAVSSLAFNRAIVAVNVDSWILQGWVSPRTFPLRSSLFACSMARTVPVCRKLHFMQWPYAVCLPSVRHSSMRRKQRPCALE